MSLQEVGAILKEAREGKHLTAADVATRLRVKEQYIKAIEQGEADKIAGNIYIIGCIKAYAALVGADASELLRKIKEDASGLLPKKELTTETSAFSYAQELAFKPDLKILLLSFSLIVLIYGIWAFWHASRISVPPVVDGKLEEMAAAVEDVLSGDMEKQYVVMPREKVQLQVVDKNGGVVVDRFIEVGEVYFLPRNSSLIVKTDRPEAVDVYLDDQYNTYVGTLDEVLRSDGNKESGAGSQESGK